MFCFDYYIVNVTVNIRNHMILSDSYLQGAKYKYLIRSIDEAIDEAVQKFITPSCGFYLSNHPAMKREIVQHNYFMIPFIVNDLK